MLFAIRLHFDINTFRVTLKFYNRRLHQYSPFRFFANEVEINVHGIGTNLGLTPLSEFETFLMHLSVTELNRRQKLAEDWKKRCVVETLKHYHRNEWFSLKSNELKCRDVAFSCVS